jgi:hypothetical protein
VLFRGPPRLHEIVINPDVLIASVGRGFDRRTMSRARAWRRERALRLPQALDTRHLRQPLDGHEQRDRLDRGVRSLERGERRLIPTDARTRTWIGSIDPA